MHSKCTPTHSMSDILARTANALFNRKGGDSVMQSTDIHWTVTQILVPQVYIIATSHVSNH